jgi:diacylglycerol kinase (ATP)
MIMHNNTERFSVNGRVGSIKHASDGVALMLKSQHNAWVHLAATSLVVITAVAFGVSRFEWCFLVVAILVVWISEALNTAFEFLCDVASPDFHPLVKKAKDVAAGAVLLSAVGAAIIGIIIFAPYVGEWV